MTTDPRGLHVLQLELECKGIVDGDRLVRIPGDEPDDIEGIQIVRYPDGTCRLLVRHDIDDELYARVARVGAEVAFDRPKLLSQSCVRGRSYVFPPDLVAPDGVLEGVAERGRPSFQLHVDGQIASYCQSSRENERSAEAWVETSPAHRRRGYARVVVAAWACSVRDAGKIAFYSHLEDNLASAGVARSLGLVPWLRYVNIDAV